MSLSSIHIGLGGVVIDGAVRDLGDLKKMNLPIFASGRTAAGPTKGGGGKVDIPISCGNVSLKPGDMDINFLLDVNLSIMVEVGRTHMLIEDLLRLEENSIVELDSMVGQPLNIRANEKLVARGEIVVINEKFAVRITDIISPDDRFAAL